ncbi:MAG TPA: hypothetical protein VGN48_06000, partial [Pedococcus sp.]|nr:hypothetical protein [Pedococcus sp.]
RRLVWLIQLSFRDGPLHGEVRLGGAGGWHRDEPTSTDFAQAATYVTAGHSPQDSVQRPGDGETRWGVPRPGLTRWDAV